jgi:tRNA(fMet)-specific endonuclease VapC
MPDYLLDTNHVTHLLGGSENLRRRVETSLATGLKFGVAMTVVGELFYAAYASQRRNDNLLALRAFLNDVIVWPYDELAAEEFGRLQAEQKAKGRPIPPLDAQIAAVARVHGLTLLTADQHFQLIDNLTVENWLA